MKNYKIVSVGMLAMAALVFGSSAILAQEVMRIQGDKVRIGPGADPPGPAVLNLGTNDGTGAGFSVITAAPAGSPQNWYFSQNAVTGAFLISNSFGGNAQVQIFPNVGGSNPAKTFVIRDGGIGIGTNNPGFNKLNVVAGHTTIADAWTARSSRRFKDNIQTLDNALDTVEQLRGVSFDWKTTGKPSIGLIAEEVGAVLPELVEYEDNGVDALSLDYGKLTALLVEAVKEQQQQIDELRRQLARQ